MAMTETQRTTLYHQLTGAIDQEAARTLMEQLPPSGWDQVATKDDVKASEKLLQRESRAGGQMLLGQLREAEGRIMVQIADSELRQAARIDQANARLDEINTRLDQTNARLDQTNARLDQTNQELSELKGEVRNGFAELTLTLARHMRWIAAVLLGFAVSMAVPLTIALL